MGLFRRRPATPRRPRPTLPVPWPRALGAEFDGSSDVMSRTGGLTGAADGKVGTLSFWCRPDAITGGGWVLAGPSQRFGVRFVSNTLQLLGKNTSGTTVLDVAVSSTALAGAWHHVLMAWDTAAGIGRIYVDGVEPSYSTQSVTNAAIDVTDVSLQVGWRSGGTGSDYYNGALAELWWTQASALDISSSAIRALFRAPAGTPMVLGDDGSGPTGAQPILYLRGLGDGFAVNSGSGGDLTVLSAGLEAPPWLAGVKGRSVGAIVLIVADATHGHTSDGIALTQAHLLAVADALHAHATDAVLLTQAHVLVLNDALHAHTADAVTLTQAHVLAVADAAHAHAADNVVLDFSAALEVADAAHAHAADSLTLSQAHVLAIADAVHAHLADTPALTQQHLLIVSDALHAHLADQLGSFGAVSVATPAGRVFVVEAPGRLLVVAANPRTLTVAAPGRTHTVH